MNVNKPLVCGLLFLLSSAGFLFTVHRLGLPREVYYGRGGVVDYWPSPDCSWGDGYSDEGLVFEFGHYCEPFSFSSATHTLTLTFGLPNYYDIILTELTVHPMNATPSPQCRMDIESLPESLRSDDPKGLHIEGLRIYRSNQIANASGQAINITLGCTPFESQDVRHREWNVTYSFYVRRHRVVDNQLVELGPLSERYSGHGYQLTDNPSVVAVQQIYARRNAERQRGQRAAELRNLSNKAIPGFFVALALSSLALLLYFQRKGT